MAKKEINNIQHTDPNINNILSQLLQQIIVEVRNTLFKGSANKRQITIITNLFII